MARTLSGNKETYKLKPMSQETRSDEFLFGKDIPWEEVGPGLKRQVLAFDDKIMLVKVKFDAGGIGELHDHFHSQVTYVESGEFELTIGDQTRTLKGGDSFYIPPNISHGCICTQGGVLIDVFSPLREEFIK